ncbi:hypothetical protein RBH26_01775 [Natronolimnohabitans sp. A-GB9]|uniref:DUF7563 family protein n=1 Tax=Natronolimnohabitans sp. A-GB9 TaxID=3069757 RepID=UPI0027B50152|nr:hypothetical protein [Natronolimnohabitans sp. A-GB9]MDQ2049204.1 hypothetical protein [Natronolimnohabitans sp. A-GB9]
MPTCGNCDGYVTRDFVRVFGIDGTVYGCPNCSTYRELCDGSGANRAVENQDERSGLDDQFSQTVPEEIP